MPGGENQLVKAKLRVPGQFLASEFQDCVDAFVKGFNNCFAMLSKKDIPYIDNVLASYKKTHSSCQSTKDSVIGSLKLLNRAIMSEQSWLKSNEVARLCASLRYYNDNPRPNPPSAYTGYSNELQELLSFITKYFVYGNYDTTIKKLQGMGADMLHMFYGLKNPPTDSAVNVSQTAKAYFGAALEFVTIFIAIVDVCKDIDMIK